MTKLNEKILNDVLDLPAIERVKLIGQLISSLDQPDKKIDSLWRKEAEERIEAYQNGQIKAVSFEQVLARYKK